MSRKFILTEGEREEIANRIAEVIREHDYKSFREFAKDYEIPPTTLEGWIKTGNINPAFLIRFSDDFKIDLRWILKGPPYSKREKLKKNK